MTDETTDLTHLEQASISFRTVDDNFDVHEDFTGLYEIASTTGECLFNMIKDVLQRFDLSISSSRGQSYDGAGSMKGMYIYE